jgi:hypothetical protein
MIRGNSTINNKADRHDKKCGWVYYVDNARDPFWRHIIRISDLSTVMLGSGPIIVITGNGELGLDSGEGA